MLWHLVQIDRQRDRTECVFMFSSMALRGLLSPSFNPPEIPTGLYMLIWELPTSCRMADLPALLHLLGGTWSCLCSKASSASTQQTWRVSQEWRWWPTTVMMVMCSICFERVSYFFFSPLSPPPFCSSRPLLGSLSILPLQTFYHLVTYEKEKEWVSEWVASQQDVLMQLSLRSHRAICLLLLMGHADKTAPKTPFQAIHSLIF